MVAPMCRLMLLLLLLIVVRGCWGGGFDDVVVESAAPGSGEASWRILEKLGRSRLLVGLFVYPFFVFVGTNDSVFGEGRWGYVYQLGRSGWCLDPTFCGGLHPLLVSSTSACWG